MMLMDNSKVKSSKTAGLLAFFLGELGIHNFYLNEKKKGFGHIALFAAMAAAFVIYLVLYNQSTNSLAHFKLSDALHQAEAAKNAIYIADALAGANFVWCIVDLVMIVKEGEAGIVKRGFRSANPEKINTMNIVGVVPAQMANPAQPMQPVQPAGMPTQPVAPAQPVQPVQPAQPTPPEQPPVNSGPIAG